MSNKNNMVSEKLTQLRVISDERGHLISIEALKNIPFAIKRVYYMYGLKGSPRGFHAHKALSQFMICLHGSVRVILDEGAGRRSETVLDSPDKGLFIGPRVWREMHDFNSDCIIVVFANEFYDESDYLRDYEQFQNFVKGFL